MTGLQSVGFAWPRSIGGNVGRIIPQYFCQMTRILQASATISGTTHTTSRDHAITRSRSFHAFSFESCLLESTNVSASRTNPTLFIDSLMTAKTSMKPLVPRRERNLQNQEWSGVHSCIPNPQNRRRCCCR